MPFCFTPLLLGCAAPITNEDKIKRSVPAPPNELQTSGLAVLLAGVDSGTRQSQ